LSQIGYEVCLITPAGRVGQWGSYTEEIYRSNAELINRGVEIITNNLISEINLKSLKIKCVFSGKTKNIKADWVIPITRREPIDFLYDELLNSKNLNKTNIKSINKVGDCLAPGMIATSIYSGYKAGIEL
jgi:dimethylamine/trimethylamine dehydrogenase